MSTLVRALDLLSIDSLCTSSQLGNDVKRMYSFIEETTVKIYGLSN